MSAAFNFITQKFDGANSPLGDATVPVQYALIGGGLLMTIIGIAAAVFQTAPTANAAVTALTGLSFVVGGATGYLGISVVGFIFMIGTSMVAPASFWIPPVRTAGYNWIIG